MKFWDFLLQMVSLAVFLGPFIVVADWLTDIQIPELLLLFGWVCLLALGGIIVFLLFIIGIYAVAYTLDR